MLINLLTTTSSENQSQGGNWVIYVILIGFLALMIVPSFLRQKKEKKAQEEKMNSITVGAKVTTIGLIHGEIVEVKDEIYVVIKTGTEENPSFITVEKRAIYQVHQPVEEVAETEEAPEDLPEEITEEAPVAAEEKIEEGNAVETQEVTE